MRWASVDCSERAQAKGESDYRSGSECYRVSRGSRRAVMAANWRVTDSSEDRQRET